jgi:hypothetical protein
MVLCDDLFGVIIGKVVIMKAVFRTTAIVATIAASLLLASCASVNRLNAYNFQGARLAVDMPMPPAPRLNVQYDVTLDKHNIVFSALSVMTNLAKANQAQLAENVMRDGLASIDVPGMIRDETFSACAFALGSERGDSFRDADFILSLDMTEWGMEARNASTAVSLYIRLKAQLYEGMSRDLVWSRTITVEQAASPAMFGLGQLIGNMVTATVLSNLTPDQLAAGFTELARETSRKVARVLSRDIERARY